MDCSQEHVFWSTPLNSPLPFFSETLFIQTTQTYVVTVCGFVTFAGQLATFKDSSPRQNYEIMWIIDIRTQQPFKALE